jgi:hypothetical protein
MPIPPNSATGINSASTNQPVAPSPTNEARALLAVVLTVRVAVPLSFATETAPTVQVGPGEVVDVTLQVKDTRDLSNPLIAETLMLDVDGCPGVTLAGDIAEADRLKSALTLKTEDALASKSLAPP